MSSALCEFASSMHRIFRVFYSFDVSHNGSVGNLLAPLSDRFYFREIIDDLGQAVNSVALSYDEGCVLASCLDSTVRLLDRFALSSTLKLSYSCCSRFCISLSILSVSNHVQLCL